MSEETTPQTTQLPPGAYDSKQSETNAAAIALLLLAAIAVALRFYTRFGIIKNASLGDICIGLALILSLGVTICTCYEVHYGAGRHIYTLSSDDLIGVFKSLWASIIIYNFGLMFTKISILLEYLRVCVSIPVRNACYAVMALVIAYGVQTFFSGLFTCTPVAAFWDQTIPGKCVDRWALFFANGGINIFIDFTILLLPVFLLRSLMIPKRQKYILMGILALGGFACVASIVRLYFLYASSISKDPTWDQPPTSLWSLVELDMGIICASASTLRPLLALLIPRYFNASRSDHRPDYRLERNAPTALRSGTEGVLSLTLRSGREDIVRVESPENILNPNLHEDLELGTKAAGS